MEENNLFIPIDDWSGEKIINLQDWFDNKVNEINNGNAYEEWEAKRFLRDRLITNYWFDIDDKNTWTDDKKTNLLNSENVR